MDFDLIDDGSGSDGDLEEQGPPCRIKVGVDWDLESQADELLKSSRAGLTKVSDKQDFLTADQLERRKVREVYNQNGVPDAHLYSGIYRRAYNPLSGTRPTNTLSSLSQDRYSS